MSGGLVNINYQRKSSWRGDDVTVAFLAELDLEMAKRSLKIGKGGTLDRGSVDQTAMNTAVESGIIQGLEEARKIVIKCGVIPNVENSR